MRFYGLALLASAVVLGACGGGENKAADTTKAATSATPSTTPAAGAAAAPTSTAAAAPITGKTVEIKMIGDATGYKFDPANVTIKAGDGVKFTVVGGGPHNVQFDADSIPAGSKDQLNANMTGEIADLDSPMLMNPGDSYTVSFGNVKPGVYKFHCTPHLAMGMRGSITVQ
jgi:plastocyanin